MSEKEIRAKIEHMCGKLDRRARSAGLHGARGALFPFLLGAGLVTVACSDDDKGNQVDYGAPGGYTSTSSTSSTGTGGDGGSGGEVGGSGGSGAASTGGSGGASTGGGGGGVGGDAGGAMEYMAPDP
ncbi:MAG: hypothetical protein JRI68_27790 [Deltaproteobacteria bacterium]|nr:hypothetical protein [Deltaproteobacteria bacterium]